MRIWVHIYFKVQKQMENERWEVTELPTAVPGWATSPGTAVLVQEGDSRKD
jgi:hypothetical protein